jgi:hypothetical protein
VLIIAGAATGARFLKGTENMKQYLLAFIFLIISMAKLSAQDDLLSLLEQDEKPKKEFVKNGFKSSRVINSHSMEMVGKGTLDFRILHRFGPLSGGVKEFFGLDQAYMRIGLDYGILDRLTVGVGRSTYKKEIDGFIKYRPFWQAKGKGASPLSVIVIGGITVSTAKRADTERKNYFTSKLGYYTQLIVGRKFSERITVQLMGTMVHQNLVKYNADKNDVFAIGIGGRIKVSKRVALMLDYHYIIPGQIHSPYFSPLSVGVDIETGGHVFQIHVTNSRPMNERAFIMETTGNILKGEIQFGFNISRAFTVGKNNKEHKKK